LLFFVFLAGGLTIMVGPPACAQERASTITPIDYFKGTWTVSIKDGPAGGFRWEVGDALDGSWLGGRVTREGRSITNDYWRMKYGTIERFAFSSDGLTLRVGSAGWQGDKLILSGVASGLTGEFNVRETITKLSVTKFLALWERQGDDGKWTVFSDETCTRVAG
jgi:hypothetical protein